MYNNKHPFYICHSIAPHWCLCGNSGSSNAFGLSLFAINLLSLNSKFTRYKKTKIQNAIIKEGTKPVMGKVYGEVLYDYDTACHKVE